jgi:hypothetical protein
MKIPLKPLTRCAWGRHTWTYPGLNRLLRRCLVCKRREADYSFGRDRWTALDRGDAPPLLTVFLDWLLGDGE